MELNWRIPKMSVITQNSDKKCSPGFAWSQPPERVHAKYRRFLWFGAWSRQIATKMRKLFSPWYASASLLLFLPFWAIRTAYLRWFCGINFCRYLRCFWNMSANTCISTTSGILERDNDKYARNRGTCLFAWVRLCNQMAFWTLREARQR